MKVHQLATRGLIWGPEHHEPSLSLGCKRLRPLAPKLPQLHSPSHSHSPSSSSSPTNSSTVSSFDLKSFIRPQSASTTTTTTKLASSHHNNKHSPPQVESTHPGGTRWNPTQEQIGILEMLYRGGMRTPNAQQIEQITSQLSRYGKIEGKNVFYWFQNHKARERQKQKRNTLGLTHTPRTPTISSLDTNNKVEIDQKEEDSPYKRKCRSWAFEVEEMRTCRDQEGDRTLELFPLHPEGR